MAASQLPDITCPSCGYDLRGRELARGFTCPECGSKIKVNIEATPQRKTRMRALGEFVGHIVKAVKTDPSKKTVRKEVEEEQRGGMVLRRTVIEEVELTSRAKKK